MENPPTDGEARRVRDCAALPRYGSRGARGEGIGPPGILVRASFPTGKPETKQRQRALFFGRELSGGTFVLRDGEAQPDRLGFQPRSPPACSPAELEKRWDQIREVTEHISTRSRQAGDQVGGR